MRLFQSAPAPDAPMKSRAPIYIAILLVWLFAVALMTAASAQEIKPVLVPQNNYQAYAATVQAQHQAIADKCDSKANALQVMAAKCASDICLALFADKVSTACDGAGGGGSNQLLVAQAPVEEKSIGRQIFEGVLDVARVGLPFVDRVMASKERRDASNSAERQNTALYGSFTSMQNAAINGIGAVATAGFGSVERTALGSFGALERGMTAAFTAPRDPTYEIIVTNSADTTLFGSSNTRNYTNKCPGGRGGDGGNSGPGGNGTPATPPAVPGAANYNGYTTAGYSGPTNCNIQK